MKQQEINLGDKVRCKYTGFSGIAVAKTEFINGCIQFSVASKWDKKTSEVPEASIDIHSLEVIKPKPTPRVKEETGGASRLGATKMRGY